MVYTSFYGGFEMVSVAFNGFWLRVFEGYCTKELESGELRLSGVLCWGL